MFDPISELLAVAVLIPPHREPRLDEEVHLREVSQSSAVLVEVVTAENQQNDPGLPQLAPKLHLQVG